MKPKESLHYALGLLAYAIARADGKIQKEERLCFADIVTTELNRHNEDFNVADIIFQVLDKEEFVTTKDAYDWAMNQIRMNSRYLSPELKNTFISVMEKIAKAYPSASIDSVILLEKFEKDMELIQNDLVC
jgi:uncharacterized tellurite resistance protein B-like protein